MEPIERLMPSVAYIVARSQPGGVIGCENQLPWRLRTDMKFFRSVTEGHVVIMGRKTFESLGRPLPNRLNIVLSSQPGKDTKDLLWANSPEMALYLADFFSIMMDRSQIIVMGGAQVYSMFKRQFTKIYLTEVFHQFANGDAFFHQVFNRREWQRSDHKCYDVSEHDEYPFCISVFEKKMKYTRHRQLREFYIDDQSDVIKNDLHRFAEKFDKISESSEEQIKLPLLVA